jgi:uncharacterized lipoprotein YddW (UPF0748 family)
MDKRSFIKTFSSGILSWSLMPSLFSNSISFSGRRKMKNWLWTRPNINWKPDEWKTLFENMNKAGIKALLPEVYNGHKAHFEHSNPMVPSTDHTLERIIPLAKAAGIEVHAWMWTMPCNNPEIIANHPDWYAVNRKGESAHDRPAYVNYYKFLDPCNPEAVEFVKGNVEALGKISELDGIHLDYVRLPDVILAEGLQPKYGIIQDKEYPEYDYSYSDLCRATFKAQYGIDPMDLEDPANHEEWVQFRYNSISNMVNNHLVPTAKKYGKTITAAVFPNWQSVRQAWHTWNLDGFLPMLYNNFYNQPVDWIGDQVAAAHDRMSSNQKPIYSGLFIPQLNAQDLEKAIEISLQNNAQGYALFSQGALKEEHWKTLFALRS